MPILDNSSSIQVICAFDELQKENRILCNQLSGEAMKFHIVLSFALLWLLLFLVGCGTTSAPTESSTKTLDKTTNSTTDTTSSSTPGSNSSSAQAEKFTRHNFAQVQADMAAGGGEHLASLASLLEIPPEQQDKFFRYSRRQFTSLYPTPETTPELLLTRLKQEWPLTENRDAREQ